jgi:uncharacterized protein
MAFNDVDTIARIRDESKTWAIVGLSADPSRPSHRVGKFLQDRGYRIIPVNPECGRAQILDEDVYGDLAEVPHEIDVVDIFRRSTAAGAVVDAAIDVGAKAVWFQVGVVDMAAARRAREAGLDVVMDTCPRIEFPRLSRASGA